MISARKRRPRSGTAVRAFHPSTHTWSSHFPSRPSPERRFDGYRKAGGRLGGDARGSRSWSPHRLGKGFFRPTQRRVHADGGDCHHARSHLGRLWPGDEEARGLLRGTYASAVEQFDSGGTAAKANVDAPDSLARIVQFQQKPRELAPRNDMERLVQSEALAQSHDLAQTRWIRFRPGQSAIPTPFLAVLVLWLGIVFAGFGLVSANRRTVLNDRTSPVDASRYRIGSTRLNHSAATLYAPRSGHRAFRLRSIYRQPSGLCRRL